MKWGIVGLGRISNRHIDAIKSIGDEIVATCDIDPLKKSDYLNYDDLLSDERVEAVAICTPNYLHAEMSVKALQLNKIVVIEKPVGMNTSEVKDVISACTSSKAYPVLQVRFNQTLQVLKNLLQENKLGKIYSVNVTVRWNRPQEYFNESDWKGKKDKDGGCLLTQGIHYLDVMLWLFGTPDTLQSTSKTLAHDIEVEDYVACLMSFGDVQGIFEFSVNSYQRNTECSISIIAEKGNIKIGGQAMNKIDLWEVSNMPMPLIQEGKPNVYAGGLYQGSCPNHDQVYKSIKEGNAIPIEESYKAIEVIQKIYEANI